VATLEQRDQVVQNGNPMLAAQISLIADFLLADQSNND
jgi:hypothetical protein